MEQQRADPSLPKRYQSRPSKPEALAGSVFKKLITKLKDKMPDPFASVHPMPPRSVIVSGVESGDQLAHMNTSTAPHVLPAIRPVKVGLPPLHFCGPLPPVPPEHSGGNGLGGGPSGVSSECKLTVDEMRLLTWAERIPESSLLEKLLCRQGIEDTNSKSSGMSTVPCPFNLVSIGSNSGIWTGVAEMLSLRIGAACNNCV